MLGVSVALLTGEVVTAAPPVPFDALASRIKRGDTITVADLSGATLRGTVLTVTPHTLTITVDGARHDFGEATLSRIERHHRFAKRGAIIGAIGGATVGVVGQVSCGITCAGGEGVLGFFGGIGAATGAAIGAAFHGSDEVYRARPTRSSSVAFSPSFSRGGVALRGLIVF